MTTNAPRAPHLAALLDEHKDEITTAWARMSQQIPGSRYGEYPLDEIRSWLTLETEATVKTLSTGSYEPTEAYIRDIARSTLESGFGIADVIEALLLFREAALPVLRRTYPDNDAQLDPAIASQVLLELRRPAKPPSSSGPLTVRSHVSNILAKLHLVNRVRATLYALQEGIISLEEVCGDG